SGVLHLVALDETKLAAALAESEANLKLSEANFARAEQLLRDKLISQQEFDQTSATFTMMRSMVELRRRTLRDTRVFAPFRGTVAARLVSPGQVITRNTPLTMLVDLETVKVELNVPERYLGQIAPGQTISFAVDAYPGRKFTGTVFFVSPQLDPATRTALVKARVPNPDRRLRGGMFAKLDLEVRLRDSALVIPEPSLVANGDNFLVFVVDSATNAVMKPVQVGLRLAGKAEITRGLAAGDLVVVEGVQKLRPGAPVSLAPADRATTYQ
ncbi:MAG: efflux RND transporter periplasmic adaptor subunit, partial [Verrucomicrobiota bacterium]